MFPYSLSDTTMTIIIDGQPYSADRSSPLWDRIKAAHKDESTDAATLIALLQPIHAVQAGLVGQSAVYIENGRVMFEGRPIANALANRILDVMTEGLTLDPWLKFATNVYANPNEWSRQELYLWLEKSELPLTDDGCFIAYKKVKNDYHDIYSGRLDYSIGTTVEMPGGRQCVDQNRNNTCSTGLHFCSKDYLPHFGVDPTGDRVLIVKINPADVVSIPADYDNTKGRTWKMEVVGEITDPSVSGVWGAVATSHGDYDWSTRIEFCPACGEPDNCGDCNCQDDEDEFRDVDDIGCADPECGVCYPPEEGDGVAEETLPAEDEVVISTEVLGDITKDDFERLLVDHGSQAGIARHFAISTGTVQRWANIFRNA